MNSQNKPFWWPDPQALIALLLVIAMIALVFILALRKEPVQDSDLLKIVVGGLMTVGFSSIVNFYFGSSKESANKGDTISRIATGDAAPPPSAAPITTTTTKADEVVTRTEPSGAGTVAKALLVAIALAMLLAGDPASAQVKLGPVGQKIANDLSGNKSSGLIGGRGSSLLAALAKPFQDIAAFIGDDADNAVALSTAVPEIQDGHGQQCWMAMTAFGKVIKAHPVPITLQVMSDFESLRLLAIATNRLCTNVHCTQVFADGSAMVQAASPIPVIAPSLRDLCTKVPQIALVDPVAIPAEPAGK